MNHSREVDASIYAFGICGMVNSAAMGAVWSYFLNDSIKVNKYFFYWYALFSAFIVHTIFWGLIVVLWPLSYIGDLNTLTLIDIWTQVIKYGGVYGGYEVILILIIVGVLVNFDKGWGFNELVSWCVVGAYFVLAGGSGFISYWFQPAYNEWFLKEEKLIKAEIEAEKKSRGGNIVVAQNTSQGPVVFDNGKGNDKDTKIDTNPNTSTNNDPANEDPSTKNTTDSTVVTPQPEPEPTTVIGGNSTTA